jgi:hypothetical protein
MKRVMVWQLPTTHGTKADETGSVRAIENRKAEPVRVAYYRPKAARS